MPFFSTAWSTAKQGRGTFVAQRKMHGLKGFLSFTEDIRTRGMTPRSQILRQELVDPPETCRTSFSLAPTSRSSTYCAYAWPTTCPWRSQDSHLPAWVCPGLEYEDSTDCSLFAMLRDRYFVHPTWTEAQVEVLPATTEEARLLNIQPGAPVLVVNGLTFTDSFEVVESVRTVYRGSGLAIGIGRQRL